MKRITVYTPAELKAKFPEAFEKAHSRFSDDQNDIPWSDEIMDSLKAVCKYAGVTLHDWSISAEGYRSYIKIGFPDYDNERDFIGQKAYNWIKANVLDGAKFKRVTYDRRRGGKGWRYDITKKDSSDWSCEFTGVCYDHDFIESLLDDIKSGCTLYDAFCNLADVASHLMEQELEYMQSEEYFLETDYRLYTKDGEPVYAD